MMTSVDIKNIQWVGDGPSGHLRLLDQTLLPGKVAYLDCYEVPQLANAIKQLSVRGAPAIGIAAAYGCVLSVRGDCFESSIQLLAASRPTAVNLTWALRRMQCVDPRTCDALLAEAKTIHDEDRQMCRRIGEHALPLVARLNAERPGLLTHCNAGALATGGIGTATAPMYLAREQGRAFTVFADETRPLLQGARLTAFELAAAGMDVTLICDNMAAQVMREGKVAMVITGADRIAANGDVANKIGTYNLAVLARHHGIPFYVAAPSSSFDLPIATGEQIPIESRPAQEITEGFGMRTAPLGIKTYSPAFDVTPGELLTAIVTENGLIEPVNFKTVAVNLAHGSGEVTPTA